MAISGRRPSHTARRATTPPPPPPPVFSRRSRSRLRQRGAPARSFGAIRATVQNHSEYRPPARAHGFRSPPPPVASISVRFHRFTTNTISASLNDRLRYNIFLWPRAAAAGSSLRSSSYSGFFGVFFFAPRFSENLCSDRVASATASPSGRRIFLHLATTDTPPSVDCRCGTFGGERLEALECRSYNGNILVIRRSPQRLRFGRGDGGWILAAGRGGQCYESCHTREDLNGKRRDIVGTEHRHRATTTQVSGKFEGRVTHACMGLWAEKFKSGFVRLVHHHDKCLPLVDMSVGGSGNTTTVVRIFHVVSFVRRFSYKGTRVKDTPAVSYYYYYYMFVGYTSRRDCLLGCRYSIHLLSNPRGFLRYAPYSYRRNDWMAYVGKVIISGSGSI